MMLRDAKYLVAYTAPLSAFLAIGMAGWWSYQTVIVSFVLIPVLELFTPNSKKNLSVEEEKNKATTLFFDLLIYLNVPLLFGLVWFYFFTLQTAGLQGFEIIGMTLSVGINIATISINVAHELGHRQTKYEQFLSKLLLIPSLYMHFFIEHNRGHHLRVATKEDPASARLGESIYAFWVRSIIGGYFHAWQLENKRLKNLNKNAFSLQNEMIRFQIIHIGWLTIIGFVFGWGIVPFALAIALSGILLLESVNYVEHYGLSRKKLPNGRYEKVQPKHSWNSNHEVGRIFLYELTRHSDHHYKSTRKYQILRHFDESPELPTGYPGAVLMTLVPPIWFGVMNERVRAIFPNDE